MIIDNKIVNNKRIDTFIEDRIPTFIMRRILNQRNNTYEKRYQNGIVIENHLEYIIFDDMYDGKVLIFKEDILVFDYSKRDKEVSGQNE